jgi:hypothetical protein
LAGITSGISGLTGSSGGGGSSANKAALAKLQADAEKLGALVDILTGANQYQSTLTQEQAIRRAEMAGSPVPTYNITVNGAIDSESTARQIVEILNDSQARGTLGAGAFDR